MDAKVNGLEEMTYNQLRNGEEMEPTECKVIGAIPSWLSGHMIRNGPGEFTVGDETYNHWFDGHAIMHKFDISDGKVNYSSKFIQSETYKTNHQDNGITIPGATELSYADPCQAVFEKFFSKFSKPPTFDNCIVNVTNLGGAYYATTDAAVAFRVDPETLDTKKFLGTEKFNGIHVITSHPHVDVNGDYYTVTTCFGPKGCYGIGQVPASGMQSEGEPLTDIKLVAKIPMPPSDLAKPSYFHSFAMSLKYFCIHDQTVRSVLKTRDPENPAKGVRFEATHEPQRESVFHVIDRKTMTPLPIKFASKGKFSFHHINSYDEVIEGKNFLVVDTLCSDGVTFFYYLMSTLTGGAEKRREIPKMWPLRYVIPVDVDQDSPKGKNLVKIPGCQATAEVREDGSVFLTPEILITKDVCEKMHCTGFELPQINYEDANQRKYKYFYCDGEDEFAVPDRLMKINVETKDAVQWYEKGRIPSEPVFIKRPGATEEDDGVLLTTVICSRPEDPIFLLILDAKTFKEVARAEVKAKLPFPVHGSFTPTNKN